MRAYPRKRLTSNAFNGSCLSLRGALIRVKDGCKVICEIERYRSEISVTMILWCGTIGHVRQMLHV